MNLTIVRKWLTGRSTIGELRIDGVFECYTLEDTVRPPGVKVPSMTAIPAGKYAVIVDFSERFQKFMPHILDVPMFTGIRIHCGNTDKDTEGCILLGRKRSLDGIAESRLAFDAFYPKLKEVLNNKETVSLTII